MYLIELTVEFVNPFLSVLIYYFTLSFGDLVGDGRGVRLGFEPVTFCIPRLTLNPLSYKATWKHEIY